MIFIAVISLSTILASINLICIYIICAYKQSKQPGMQTLWDLMMIEVGKIVASLNIVMYVSYILRYFGPYNEFFVSLYSGNIIDIS